jgi:hypothetical protein
MGKACPKCNSQHVKVLEHFSVYGETVHGLDPMNDSNKKFETRACISCGQKWERRWKASTRWSEVKLR